jgi:hypothetical protein
VARDYGWLLDGTLLSTSSLVPLHPQKMKNFDEIAKGLGRFVKLWNTMENTDISDELRRRNEPLSYY